MRKQFTVSILSLAIMMSSSMAAYAKGGSSEEHSAVYLVPVEPSLVKYSLFTNVVAKVRPLPTGQIKLEYDIPQELTGAINSIEFVGMPDPSGIVEMTGPYGRARCEGGAALGKCELEYTYLYFDHNLRDQLLSKISGNDTKALAARLAVAEAFEQLVLSRKPNAPVVPGGPRGSISTQSLSGTKSISFFSDGSHPHGILEIL